MRSTDEFTTEKRNFQEGSRDENIKPELKPSSAHEHQHMEPGAHQHEHHTQHGGHKDHQMHEDHGDHAMMVDDFKKRFFVSLSLMLPILLLAPMILSFLPENSG